MGVSRYESYEDFIESNTTKEGECLLWNGFVDLGGYARGRLFGKSYQVHRLVFTRTHGNIDKGLCVRQTCGNKNCVSNAHLYLADLTDTKTNFWSKVSKEGSCWNWKAGKNSDGYGVFRAGTHNELAHRYSYMISVGVIPDNLMLCHTCDNPSCVNPKHLFLGDQFANMQDMLTKGRGRWQKTQGLKDKILV